MRPFESSNHDVSEKYFQPEDAGKQPGQSSVNHKIVYNGVAYVLLDKSKGRQEVTYISEKYWNVDDPAICRRKLPRTLSHSFTTVNL